MCRVAAFRVFLLVLVMTVPLVALAASEEELYQSGLSALRAGDAQTAVNLLGKAIQSRPEDYRFYNDRGVAYKVLGSWEKALADYTKAIELKPEYVPALNNRGVLYLQRGSHDKAIADFTEALKHGGIESKVLTNIGWAYANKGDYRDAQAYLEKALAARPLDPRSFILMGQTLEQLGDSQRALQMYQLGVGLLHDPGIVERVEARIENLEKGTTTADSSTQRPERQAAREKSADASKAAAPSSEQRRNPARQVVHARPLSESPVAPRKAPPVAAVAGVDTPESLNERARSAAVKKLSPAAAEICRQGVDFVEKGDLTKALVRFEDTLNIERRNKNHHGVAWSSLEIGRVYAKLGDPARAAGYFEVAEKLFRRSKASDETVLALIDLGNAKRKAGQKEQAAAAFKQAEEIAQAAGHRDLAKILDDAQAGKVTQLAQAKRPTPPPAPRIVEAPEPQAVVPKKASAPVTADKVPPTVPPRAVEEKKQIAAPPEKIPAPPVPATAKESVATKAAPVAQPVARSRGGVEAGVALSAAPELKNRKVQAGMTPDKAAEKNLKQDLAALKRYRELDDEPNMIVILERLAQIYLSRNDPNKASLCLSTAVMLREKLGLEHGKDRIVQQRGVLREILGDSAGALEDFTWALALSSTKPGSQVVEPLEQRSRKIAGQLRLDEAKALAAYRSLWKARQDGDPQRETEACYTIAGLYERANKSKEALNYYERALASILVDKARMYKKIGDAARAEESYNLALETFRKLDYPKYVHLMKQLKAAKTLSKQ